MVNAGGGENATESNRTQSCILGSALRLVPGSGVFGRDGKDNDMTMW